MNSMSQEINCCSISISPELFYSILHYHWKILMVKLGYRLKVMLTTM